MLWEVTLDPSVTVPASLSVLAKYPNLKLLLVGDEKSITQELSQNSVYDRSRVEVIHTTEQVAMDDLPSIALRSKKILRCESLSNKIKEGSAHACVSAGNTGALMAIARFVLKMLPGIDRPA